jgi:hypothetical protein
LFFFSCFLLFSLFFFFLKTHKNEAIAATGIYYYDMHTISRSILRFRQFFDAENELLRHPQHRYAHLEAYYSVLNRSARVQSHGFIQAMQGRLVTFPNFQQHRVEPFELEDKTKPGYRRILAFFLVHPDRYIASTKWVPPQQMPIVAETVDAALRTKLPREISLMVAEGLGKGVMTEQEAEEHASVLMEERRETDGGWQDIRHISFCEH